MKLYSIIPLISIILRNTVFAYSDNFIYEDALSKPHYQIYFTDQVLDKKEVEVLERETKNEIIKMISKENNEHYICEIPKVKKKKEKIIRRSNVSNVKTALALLEPLKNKCLYHTSGWWSYEFCYGKSIRQYHIADKGEPARFNSNYILGKYTKYLELSSGKTEETKELVRIIPNGRNYFTQKFIDGTKCDKTNIPRTAEIQYFCGIDENIVYVKETSTCNYEVAISTNKLCKDPVFNPQINSSLNSIICYLHKTEEEYKNSLTSEDDYFYDYDDDQTDSEKLSEIHKKYKKENMRKASDIFKSKWMKSVNYKGKKIVFKSFLSSKDELKEDKNNQLNNKKKEDFTEINLKLLELLKESENQKTKEKNTSDNKNNENSITSSESKNVDSKSTSDTKDKDSKSDKTKGFDDETLNFIMNKLEQLNKKDKSSENEEKNKPGQNPHDIYLTTSETKQIILDEAVRVNEDTKKKFKSSPPKEVIIEKYIKSHPDEKKEKEDDNDETTESS